jgi:ParB family transcriptional regulator, chromosome partitioning protein
MALGKSLGNILDDYFGESQVTLFNQEKNKRILLEEIEISQIGLNPYQTRRQFDSNKIQSLAKNIQVNGLIHPILVLKKTENPNLNFDSLIETKKENSQNINQNLQTYSLLAGERRLRAVQFLGNNKILAIIKTEENLNLEQQAMLTAMENLQREDLNALEMAETFEMLIKTQKLSEEKLADILGHSVQYVKNYLRLLTLTNIVKEALKSRKIGEGQARYLVGLSEAFQAKILEEILKKNLTVREIAELIKKLKSPKNNKEKSSLGEFKHSNAEEIMKKADKIANLFPKSKLRCSGNEEKGKIIISWG